MIWWRNSEDWEEEFKRRIPQPRAALGVVSKLPAVFPSPKLNRSFPVYRIYCYWMNNQVDPTRSNLASAILNSKIRPRAVVGYGVKIFLPSPPNYVNRSPGYGWRPIFIRKTSHLDSFRKGGRPIRKSTFSTLIYICDLEVRSLCFVRYHMKYVAIQTFTQQSTDEVIGRRVESRYEIGFSWLKWC